MHLSRTQIDQINDIGHLALECATEMNFAQIISDEILRLFSARSAVLLEHPTDHSLGSSTSYGLDNAHSIAYGEHYHTLDPVFALFQKQLKFTPNPVVATQHAISSWRSYRDSGYYRDFLAHAGVDKSVIFGISSNAEYRGLFGLHRGHSDPHFTDDECNIVRLIEPYLSQALRFRSSSQVLPTSDYALSPRQQDIALRICRGMSNQEIADDLGLARKTIENQITAMFQIVGVKNRTQLAHFLIH